MAKRKYLIIFFFSLCHSNIYSGAWLVEEEKILTIHSIEISNNFTDDLKSLTAKYYNIEEKIQHLYDLKNQVICSPYFIDPISLQYYALKQGYNQGSADTYTIKKNNSNILKRLDQKIEEFKNLQMSYNPYYSIAKFSEYIEFGISSNVSIFAKVFVNILKNNYPQNNLRKAGYRLFNSDIELGSKFKLYQSDKFMLSMHNTLIASRLDNILGEFKISTAYKSPNKLGENIKNIEFGISIPIYYNDNYMLNKKCLSVNYQSINKFNKYQFMIIAKQFCNFYPYEHTYKKLFIRNSLSIVKNLSSIEDSYDFAIEIGYYHDIMVRPLKTFDNGIAISLWKKF